jgi:hypothetical protein
MRNAGFLLRRRAPSDAGSSLGSTGVSPLRPTAGELSNSLAVPIAHRRVSVTTRRSTAADLLEWETLAPPLHSPWAGAQGLRQPSPGTTGEAEGDRWGPPSWDRSGRTRARGWPWPRSWPRGEPLARGSPQPLGEVRDRARRGRGLGFGGRDEVVAGRRPSGHGPTGSAVTNHCPTRSRPPLAAHRCPLPALGVLPPCAPRAVGLAPRVGDRPRSQVRWLARDRVRPQPP